MKKTGFNLQQIAFVTGHSNYQSLVSYLAQPDDEDYEEFNDKMFNFVNKKDAVENKENEPNARKPKATVSKPNDDTTLNENKLKAKKSSSC